MRKQSKFKIFRLKGKKYFMAAMATMLLMTVMVLTSCSDDDETPAPTPTPTDNSTLVGNWTVDITGKSFPLWSYGPALHMMTFEADGTGSFDTFYTHEDKPVARDYQTFTYTTTTDGHLTMEMDDGIFEYTYQIADGRLILSYDDKSKTYDKASADMVTKFGEWGKQDLVKVPNAARYTVFVYGNAGGKMDYVIEDGFWEMVKPYLTDSTNVRVVCFYKYGKDQPEEGKPFTGKYADPGDIVWFELSSKTDLNKLREEGFASHGFAEQAKKLKLCDPASIRMFMELSSLLCPAEEYIFTIWGHGNGFEPMYDVPGKYDLDATRGVIGDEWNDGEKLDMYELAEAIRATGKSHINTLFFHNCLMGNMESLAEVRDVADYLVASAHLLSDSQGMLAEFIHSLQQSDNVNDAMKLMFQTIRPAWDESYPNDSGHMLSGDLKLISSDALGDVIDATKLLADRLLALYPTQKEAIDRATAKVYRFRLPSADLDLCYFCPFFDLADYAHKLAEETGDAEFAAISTAIDQAFSRAILQYADVNYAVQRLDHYTLSVCLYHQLFYDFDYVGAGNPYNSNIRESYEQSTFHKLTGWGNWLSINTGLPWGNPTSGGGGRAE